MENHDIRKFFERKEIEEDPCPLTDELIQGGYIQKSGGYIKTAKQRGINNPTQYWHLIECWSKSSKPNAKFDRRIQCGELIFWMAEVSKAVDIKELEELKEEILRVYKNSRREGNRKIQQVCFDKIIHLVAGYPKKVD